MKCWIVVYRHRHGDDSWPLFQDERPSIDKIIAELDDFESDRNESIELVGPFDVPQ